MEKFMKIPYYIPLLGILISLALFIFVASNQDMNLLIVGVVLFHLSGWILTAKFFISTLGLFSSVLDTK
ncbi:MAG: hypothetical protein V2A54_00045 [Bacteroidota bacterium]